MTDAHRSCVVMLSTLLLLGACSSSHRDAAPREIKTVVLTPSARELPDGWSVGDFRSVIQRAADRWSYPNVPCGVRVVVAEPQPQWLAIEDGKNLVVVRERSWCHNGRCSPSTTYPLRATAMTTTYPEGARGRSVVEGDVEINAVFFQLMDGQREGTTSKRPVRLESVVAHEIGHVLGLPDVCGQVRTASGRPETSGCSTDDRARMMFAAGAHEALTPGDVAALCALYPPVG